MFHSYEEEELEDLLWQHYQLTKDKVNTDIDARLEELVQNKETRLANLLGHN